MRKLVFDSNSTMDSRPSRPPSCKPPFQHPFLPLQFLNNKYPELEDFRPHRPYLSSILKVEACIQQYQESATLHSQTQVTGHSSSISVLKGVWSSFRYCWKVDGHLVPFEYWSPLCFSDPSIRYFKMTIELLTTYWPMYLFFIHAFEYWIFSQPLCQYLVYALKLCYCK